AARKRRLIRIGLAQDHVESGFEVVISHHGVKVVAELCVLRNDDRGIIVLCAERVKSWHGDDRKTLGELVDIYIGNAELLRGVLDSDLAAANVFAREPETRLIDDVRRED